MNNYLNFFPNDYFSKDTEQPVSDKAVKSSAATQF
ncbi:hypothetical protein PANA5342_0072 [Pantoea ananatis LMG 5342]|nr:hypothetical protein PANA5342_0072 [Pantoea ananatis LMG 5342]